MADDMCGPSNGAKNLLSHVNRDRSLHQDRIVGGPSGGTQSFRSQQPTNAGDAAFQSFLSAPVGLQAGPSVPSMIDQFDHMDLAYQQSPAMGVAQTRAANAGMDLEAYQRFMQGMGDQPGVAPYSIAGPLQSDGALVNPQAVMGAPVGRNATPTSHLTNFQNGGNFMSQGFPMTPMSAHLTQQTGPFSMATAFGQATSVNVPAAFEASQADPALTFPAAAFDAAFAEFDEGEFEEERRKWMAEHGPAAELARQHAGEPTDAEWDQIEVTMEEIADAADAARQAGAAALQNQEQEDVSREEQNNLQASQELVKAATDILSAVSDNNSEKFKNSTFLELMRRIRAEEITIMNNSLVDVQTGAELPISHDGGNAGESSSTGSNTGVHSDPASNGAPVINP